MKDSFYSINFGKLYHRWISGASVVRLTPDQKVACSIHIGFMFYTECVHSSMNY